MFFSLSISLYNSKIAFFFKYTILIIKIIYKELKQLLQCICVVISIFLKYLNTFNFPSCKTTLFHFTPYKYHDDKNLIPM